jgi:hypothetical protein
MSMGEDNTPLERLWEEFFYRQHRQLYPTYFIR